MQPLLHWTQEDIPPTLPEPEVDVKKNTAPSPDGRLGAAIQLMS